MKNNLKLIAWLVIITPLAYCLLTSGNIPTIIFIGITIIITFIPGIYSYRLFRKPSPVKN